MAPIDDSTADELRGLVKKLEMRVQELETKLTGRDGSGANPLSAMRMVIMGPPGAGKLHLTPGERVSLLTTPQARVPKHHESRTSTAFAIWYRGFARSGSKCV